MNSTGRLGRDIVSPPAARLLVFGIVAWPPADELVRDVALSRSTVSDDRMSSLDPDAWRPQFQPLRLKTMPSPAGLDRGQFGSVDHKRARPELGWHAAHAGLTQRPIGNGVWLTPVLRRFSDGPLNSLLRASIIDLDTPNDRRLRFSRGVPLARSWRRLHRTWRCGR